jgi:hypothetical protein
MPQALSALAVGAKVEVPVNSAYQSRFGAKLVFKIADKNHTGYPSNSVTLITERIIQLMAFDAMEPTNTISDRKTYGNNRYLHANLLSWMNSNAAAGAWYSAKHTYDAPPTNANVNSGWNDYDTWAGFLAMMDANFVAAIQNTTVTTARNTVADGGGSESVTSKFFLASTTEVGLANENGIAEGSLLALFSNDASRVAYPTTQAVSNSEYTNASLNASSGWYWWLRTPYSSNARSVRNVNASGALYNYNAFYGYYGIRPLCNLQSGILVSDSVNGDGNYTFVYNTAPTAPPNITAPGQAFSGQNISLSCGASTDAEGNAITYIWERAYNGGAYVQVQSSSERTFSEMVSSAWNTLQYRVKASDGTSSSAYTSSGTITVIHNQPPAISGSNGDLGVKREGFGYDYTVTDADNDTVNVVEKLDGAAIATKNGIVLGAQQTAQIDGNNFTALTNAQHTIAIQATDSAGGITTRTLTFTKAISGFVIELAEPYEVSAQPTRCFITINRDIPAGGTMKVEACNNPFDVAPTWEDCTAAVISSLAYVFQNNVNTATQRGLSVRVTVERGTALTTCWVSGIGVNFE